MKSSFARTFLLSIALVVVSSTFALAGNDDLKVALEIKNSSAESSSWVFESDVNAIIDSYSSFIFRTKKSQELSEVKFLVNVDSFGKIVGFELIGQEDKGLKERLDYVVRQLPKCKPAQGHTSLKSETFEIMIKK